MADTTFIEIADDNKSAVRSLQFKEEVPLL